MEATRHEFLHMEGPLKVSVYVLTVVSLGLAGAQFYVRWRLWNTGKPNDWPTSPWERIKSTILEQRKVMGSRPKSGAPMHLLIFYGFLSLLLATTLLGIATYAPLLGIPNFHRGNYYLAYESIFDVLGLLFVVGVAWALGRRILLDRRGNSPLTSEAKDYVALVVLLMVGVTGYLIEAARIRNSPGPGDTASVVGYQLAAWLPPISDGSYIGLYFFHMIWIWGFFAFLPQMRLKHIVVATMTAAQSPDRPMGELRPISLAEVEQTGRIGAEFATDLSRWHLMSLDACMGCGRCTEVCPAHGVGKPLNPKDVVANIHQALVIGDNLPARISEASLWACTTCHACVEACPVLIRHVDLIVDARRNLVAEGKLSGASAVMLRQVGSTGHAWGAVPNTREDWMKGLSIPLARDGKPFEFLFWVGCAGSSDPAAVRTTKAVAKLLAQAGVSFACLGKEEACTGDPARRVGDEFTFQEQAGKNVSVFEKYQVSKIVTACPHCLNSLLNEYHQFGPKLEVVHHTQLLRDLVDSGKLKAARPAPGSVTYHDPCYLARVNNESDAPRALVGDETELNSGVPLLLKQLGETATPLRVLAEPEHHGRKTLCCGAGGGRMWMDEVPSQRPGDKRAMELLATGAQTVAVACPFCRIMLDASLKQVAPHSEINLVDMAELLQAANQPHD